MNTDSKHQPDIINRNRILKEIGQRIMDGIGTVVLKGPGGIGKSTLTTQISTSFQEKDYNLIIFRGKTSPEQILESTSNKAMQLGIKEAKHLYNANKNANEKLRWFLENFIWTQKILIIFDDFDENLQEKNGSFHSKRLKDFLIYFKNALKKKESCLLFSTRVRIPGFNGKGITQEIPELNAMEFSNLVQSSSTLKFLDKKYYESLYHEIGGNPQGLKLLDKIANEEFNRKEFTWEQLKDLIPELQRRIIEKTEPGDDFTPIYLQRLFTYLTESQQNLLAILSVFRNPIPYAAIKAFNISLKRIDLEKLISISLVESKHGSKNKFYYVHRLIAQYVLKRLEKKTISNYHLQAAQYFENLKDKSEKINLNDAIEARWHYIQAGEWNQAAEITFSLDTYLTAHGLPQRSLDLVQELTTYDIDDMHRLVTYGRMGNLYQDFGDYDLSMKYHKKAYDIAQKMNDLKHTFTSLHQIGMIYEEKGDYEEALKHYRQSCKIAERIRDTKGIAASLHNIGTIYQEKGDYMEALKHYQQSKELAEKISDIKGVALSIHQIGTIHQSNGDYDEALNCYRQSLEVREKINDIKGIAKSLGQIGMIYVEKDQYEEALKHYGKSLEICEKIGDIHCIALTFHQIGTLSLKKNELSFALKYFIHAYQIFNKIGSPNAGKVKVFIEEISEKLPPEELSAILKEFG